MRHVDARDWIGHEDAQQGAGGEVEQSLSRAQHRQRALLAHDIEDQFFFGFFWLIWHGGLFITCREARMMAAKIYFVISEAGWSGFS